MLPVGDGQEIFYEVAGNPDGIPAVFVHGGPGGGTSRQSFCFFDPRAYRIIRFDQRGCGRSTPSVADPAADVDELLEVNTTAHLIADMERLRTHLNIDRWLVFGGSWGSTLSLAYAQAHPDKVLALVLRGIFLLRKTELDFYYNGGAGHIFPEYWDEFLGAVDEHLRPAADDIHGRTRIDGVDLIEQYHRLLHSSDWDTVTDAARRWSMWEGLTSHLDIPHTPGDHGQQAFDVAFARIENHYFVNHAFIGDGQLLEPGNIDKIRDIPAVIVQGRYDVVCPMKSAWQLHRAWPEAEFHVSDRSGHAADEAQTAARLVAATDNFARRFG
ncbi:prolyl aminopeptidase [Corynebacterium mendelii]|uniref:Proline iminopeptidase n=1 Tax=Corynebacterium mendelii TaxID=2765362 RepID=A0A939DZL1_9CORY|nr:prolyl aminopeptidase [Corynebacterium mendelii]MBN9643021.1 prolyl aminopeptidase [Corynebacterium mendelii]